MSKNSKHIIQSKDFTMKYLDTIFTLADKLCEICTDNTTKEYLAMGDMLKAKTLFSIFYEPSTRTRISFETAAANLGMRIRTTENAAQFSSAAKGELLEDSIRVLTSYKPDVIVLRHTDRGAADRAVWACELSDGKVTIVNAGDGDGQHPTQALLDVYAINKKFPIDKPLEIILGGDLRHSRTVHSLVYLLAKRYKLVSFTFMSLPSLSMKQDLLDHLDELKIPWKERFNIENAHWESKDVVYWTRTQKERASYNLLHMFNNFRKNIGFSPKDYKITKEMAQSLPERAIILHPLPKIDEIASTVDFDSHAYYFEQAEGGLYIRMAILCDIFEIGIEELN